MQRDLVERAMVGDREAFTELGGLWIDRLYATARLILRDGDRAQDATQEALIAAWRDIKGLRDPDRFEPWLRRLLVNACYREARSIRRRWAAEGRVRPLAGTFADPALAAADHDAAAHARSTGSGPSSGRSWSCTTTWDCRCTRPRWPLACRSAP